MISSCNISADDLRDARPAKSIRAGVQIVYSSAYRISLGGLEKLHPFDIRKYDRIYRALEKDGLISVDQVHVPSSLTCEQVLRVHTTTFWESLSNKEKVATYLEAPQLKMLPQGLLRKGVVDPFLKASGGTLLAAELALKHGAAINLGGGYHHAKPDAGEGFCLFADVPIAIRLLQDEGKVKRVLVVDTDVHQGNGTICCLPDDPSTFTFSMHQQSIYPIPKEQGDRDVQLSAGMGDQEYLTMLKRELSPVIETFQPDFIIHVAGCDTLEGDPLASLSMSHEGIKQRDLWLYRQCRKRQIPYLMTLSGGYSKGAWKAQYESIKVIMAE